MKPSPLILGLFFLGALLSLRPLSANAGSVQMLPPTDFSAEQKPCSSTTGGVLQWDGQSSIKCIPGSSGDASGNVDLKGYVAPGNFVLGSACTTEGALGYDSSSTEHQLVYCSADKVWASAGGKPKAAATFAGTTCATNCPLLSQANVASVRHLSTGNYQVCFLAPSASANYVVNVSSSTDPSGNLIGNMVYSYLDAAQSAHYVAPTNACFTLAFYVRGNGYPTDPIEVSVTVH